MGCSALQDFAVICDSPGVVGVKIKKRRSYNRKQSGTFLWPTVYYALCAREIPSHLVVGNRELQRYSVYVVYCCWLWIAFTKLERFDDIDAINTKLE